MTVRYGREDLFHYDSCISLTVIGALNDLVKKLTTATMFGHNEVPLWVLVYLKQSDDVRMIHVFQEFNLR